MNRIGLISKCSLLTLNLIMCDPCWQINSLKLPRYKLMKSNGRLDQMILSRTTVRNVQECVKFAQSKKALAFNYGLQSNHYEMADDIEKQENVNMESNKGIINVVGKMCQALECPEIHNFTMLTRDKNYNYYSTYLSFLTTGTNFTLACIPRTGMFVFSSKNLNYSQAQAVCQEMNASLAHIVSVERTNGLANYISHDAPTFVGLSSHNNGLWKNEFDEPLSCFDYRAWGNGEPSHSKGCVTLMQSLNSKIGPFWKVVPCRNTLPFICEISPMF